MTRKYNKGLWTEGRFKGFVVGLLRAGSRKWPPKWAAMDKAHTGQKINPKTGRQAAHYKCAKCGFEFPAKEVQVDHKKPVISEKGFTTWDDYVEKLFCEETNLQVLCVKCHKAKTKLETTKRKEERNK